jgi:hypothetical protein
MHVDFEQRAVRALQRQFADDVVIVAHPPWRLAAWRDLQHQHQMRECSQRQSLPSRGQLRRKILQHLDVAGQLGHGGQDGMIYEPGSLTEITSGMSSKKGLFPTLIDLV